MNKNILIVLGGGFLVALLVAIIVQASFSNKKEGMVEILVASKAVTTGDTVSDTNFKWQEWPEASVVPGAVVRKKSEKITDVAKGRLSYNFV